MLSPEPLPIALVEQGLRALGSVMLPVIGTSMVPTLASGTKVLVETVDPTALQPGDVIAFRLDNQLVVHRVHDRVDGQLLTAGDGNPFFDPLIPLSSVVGVVRNQSALPAFHWSADSSAGERDTVDVWMIGDPEVANLPTELPPHWRLHLLPRYGVGVSATVLAELTDAVAGKPCIGVNEHAVNSAARLLRGPLPAELQILIGCSFGSLDEPMTGHLIPAQLANIHVRVGAPQEHIEPDQSLARLVTLAAGRPEVSLA